MGNIGDSITPSIPVVGSAGPQFASDINAILTEVVSRLSAKIPLSSVNFNANLDLSGSDLVNIGNIVFSNQVSTPSGSPFNRFAVFGGNLFYVNSGGAIQITSGATLNAAALAGITGDYGGANPAQLNYVAVDTRYNHFANFGTGQWAYDRALGFDVAGGATSTAFARIVWGGGSNITLTLPATLPGANQLLTVDNTGAITAGTTAAMALNSNITISGTGTYKHGTKTTPKTFTFSDVIVVSGSLTGSTNAQGVTVSSASVALFRLPEMALHQRLINLSVGFAAAISRTGVTCQIVKWGGGDPATTTTTNVGSALANSGTAQQSVSGVNAQLSTGESFWLKVTTTSGGTTINSSTMDWDIP